MSSTEFYYYTITAINKECERVYLFYDKDSGGYPYWSTRQTPPNFGTDLMKVVEKFDEEIEGTSFSYLAREVDIPSIARVNIKLEPVDRNSEQLVQKRKERALEKLTDEEKVLLGLK